MAPKYNLQTLFSRRELLGLMGAAGTAFVAACNTRGRTGVQPARPTATAFATSANVTPSALACIVTPQETEGPYFVDEQLNRSDITSDPSDGSVQDGVPLALNIRAFRVENGACTPLIGATIDIWHCNAAGVYSDESANNSLGKKFLRGLQTTDANGAVSFATIYPGWYQGRTVHIHFKIRTNPSGRGAIASYEYTSQLYFDDATTDEVYTQAPYNIRGARATRNNNDGIYTGASTDARCRATAASSCWSSSRRAARATSGRLTSASTSRAPSATRRAAGPPGHRTGPIR